MQLLLRRPPAIRKVSTLAPEYVPKDGAKGGAHLHEFEFLAVGIVKWYGAAPDIQSQ
jgi:hypothetical protein